MGDVKPAGRASRLGDHLVAASDFLFDAALVVAIVAVAISNEVVISFHIVFMLVTVDAFRRSTPAFAIRAVVAFAAVTVLLFDDWQAGTLPADELAELPLLSAIPIFVHIVARRRQQLTAEVERSHEHLEQLQRERLDSLQEQILLSMSVESTGWLTASATHDLNNILATILAANEEMAATHADDTHEATDHIARAIAAAGRLVGDIADLTGAPAGERYCRFDEVVAETVELHTQVDAQNLVVELDLATDDAMVHLPRVLLYQLVSNLVVNAIKAMNADGVLRVETKVEPRLEAVVLKVSDSGDGMSDDVLARAFEPHFTTRPGSGTGLGLSTVRRIVDAVGADVEVETSPGHGATFTVTIPLAAPTAFDDASPPPTGRPTRVLVVDDESTLVDQWCQRLRDVGYDVEGSAGGLEALRLVDELGDDVIDVLVTDVNMPGLDGLELGERLRQRFEALTIVLVSGAPPELPAGWGDDGQSRFLAKPFATEALVDAIEDLLALRHPVR